MEGHLGQAVLVKLSAVYESLSYVLHVFVKSIIIILVLYLAEMLDVCMGLGEGFPAKK
jgi:uncharacterized membrane protein YgaE (UPF0421/DUF939 family)